MLSAPLLYILGVFLGIVCFVFSWVVYYIDCQHRKYEHIPGPPRDNFFLGHIPSIRKLLNKKEPLSFYHWLNEYGHTFCIFLLHRAVVVTVDPAGVKEFLVTGSHPKDEDGYRSGKFVYGKYRFLGNGLVTEMDHEKWASRRAIFNPSFQRKSLKEFMNQFNIIIDDLMRKLQGLADGKTHVSFLDEMNRVALDIIGMVAFGKHIDSIHNKSNPFPKALFNVGQGLYDEFKNPHNRILPVQLKLKQKTGEALTLMRETGRQWLEECRQALANEEYMMEDILASVVKAYDDKDPESLETCLDDIVTFFIAGHETTAGTLSFLLLEIGRRPEVYKKLQEEVDQVMGDKPMVEYNDLEKLEYLSQLLNETLRLYPPASMTMRKTSYDTTVQGFHIPQGTSIWVDFYSAARMPEFHNDPHDFRPERFHKESSERPSMYSFMPFSLGPRSCIGRHFAMIEASIIVAKLMQHFNFTLDPNQSFGIIQGLTPRPEGGTTVTLTMRRK